MKCSRINPPRRAAKIAERNAPITGRLVRCAGRRISRPGACRRTFNWPSQLQPHERVWLILGGAGVCQATLNNQPLGATDIQLPARLEITSRLESHNELLVDSTCESGGVPLGEVRLEISTDSGSALDASLE